MDVWLDDTVIKQTWLKHSKSSASILMAYLKNNTQISTAKTLVLAGCNVPFYSCTLYVCVNIGFK